MANQNQDKNKSQSGKPGFAGMDKSAQPPEVKQNVKPDIKKESHADFSEDSAESKETMSQAKTNKGTKSSH